MTDFKSGKPVLGAPAMAVFEKVPEPEQSAVDLPDGTLGRGSTGQLFEVKKGLWEKVAEAWG